MRLLKWRYFLNIIFIVKLFKESCILSNSSSLITTSLSTPSITSRSGVSPWAHAWPFPTPTCSWASLNRTFFILLARSPTSGCNLTITSSFYGLMVPTPSPSFLNASMAVILSSSPGHLHTLFYIKPINNNVSHIIGWEPTVEIYVIFL